MQTVKKWNKQRFSLGWRIGQHYDFYLLHIISIYAPWIFMGYIFFIQLLLLHTAVILYVFIFICACIQKHYEFVYRWLYFSYSVSDINNNKTNRKRKMWISCCVYICFFPTDIIITIIMVSYGFCVLLIFSWRFKALSLSFISVFSGAGLGVILEALLVFL